MAGNTERGFGTITLYAALAAGAVILALGLALKVQSSRLDAAKANYEACQTRYAETLKLVEKQNKAVADLEKEGKERAKRAADALAKARQGVSSLQTEIDRLRAVKPADCAASVAAVRQGLKP